MNPVPADSKNNVNEPQSDLRELLEHTQLHTLAPPLPKKQNRSEIWLQPKVIASKTSTGTVKKQLQCLWCIPKRRTQTCFPLNKDLLAGTFVEAALGFVSQPQLTSTCFESPWKSRSGFNNKSSKFFEFSCTERETGEGNLVETVLQKLPMQPAVQVRNYWPKSALCVL